MTPTILDMIIGAILFPIMYPVRLFVQYNHSRIEKIIERVLPVIHYTNQLKLPTIPWPKRDLCWYKRNAHEINDKTIRMILQLPDELSLRILGEWVGADLNKSSNIQHAIRRYLWIEKRTFLRNNHAQLINASDDLLRKYFTKSNEDGWANMIFNQESDYKIMAEIAQSESIPYTQYHNELCPQYRLFYFYAGFTIVSAMLIRELEFSVKLLIFPFYIALLFFLLARCFKSDYGISLWREQRN